MTLQENCGFIIYVMLETYNFQFSLGVIYPPAPQIRGLAMPLGVTDHLAEQRGFIVTKVALDEVATLSGVMRVGNDYLLHAVRE